MPRAAKLFITAYIFILFSILVIADSPHIINGTLEEENLTSDLRMLFGMNWKTVQTPFTIALWLLMASVAKILFHVNKKFGDAIPDSALLIVVGLLLGFSLKELNVDEHLFTLEPHTFFLYLLPPIIFDAGYFMPNRQLFENFDSVVLFSVVGTIFNALAIGVTLHQLRDVFTVQFTLVEILLFASLISAVDPVAVIAVFEEVHVNAFLFVNVFGEALFNDGVAVVLYKMFNKITLIGTENLKAIEFLYCFLSFFVISFGGIFIGLFYAIVVSLATRFTSRVKIVAPVFIFVVPYLSYLTAELFEMSSILAITTCGIAMKQYVKGNITGDASSSVKYFVKTLAQCSETVLFMFLGLSTISRDHVWDFGFMGITIILCLIYRCIGVVVQCAVLNRFRKNKFSVVDQFILSYGGLRGAIAFGLVISMPNIGAKQMFITACIAVIFFTVFVQGITIRPLVYWLKVERLDKERKEKMIEKVYSRYCDFTMAGIEEIAGFKGPNAIREAFERFNAKVLKPLLMRHERQKVFDASDILRAYKKIALREAAQIVATLDELKAEKYLAEKNASPVWNTDLSQPRSHYIPQNGELHQSHTTSEIDHIQTMSEDSTKNIFTNRMQRNPSQQSINQQINTDVLYDLFSKLLDQKIAELSTVLRRNSVNSSNSTSLTQTPNILRRRPREHDIKDNYMEIMMANGADADSLVVPANNACPPGEDKSPEDVKVENPSEKTRNSS